MNPKLTLPIILLSALAVQCHAQGRIVAQLQAGHAPEELPLLFPVTVKDWTPQAPFALLEPLPGNDIHVIEGNMRSRTDVIVFAEDDHELTAPENVGAGKGGTVAAVFDAGGGLRRKPQPLGPNPMETKPGTAEKPARANWDP